MISAARAADIRRRYEASGREDAKPVIELGKKAHPHPSNEELGELEYYEFMTNKPDKVFAYYKGDARVGEAITTWMGWVIGHITWRGTERRPMGGKVVAIHVRGANGVNYVGNCNLSSGNYCRLRRAAAK